MPAVQQVFKADLNPADFDFGTFVANKISVIDLIKPLLLPANAGKAIVINAAGDGLDVVPLHEVFVGAVAPPAADAWDGTKGYKFWLKNDGALVKVFAWHGAVSTWEEI